MEKESKQKEKGITVKKVDDFSEWFTQLVQKAELADIRYGVQGFVVHMPWAMYLSRKIYDYFEAAVEADNHEPMFMPLVIPEENLKKEAEHAGFIPDVFWVTEAGTEKLERKLALRPTGETQIYPMYNLWIRSYHDLPFKRYQSRITVFRNEMTTRPFIRGREFMFFETHDVFATHEEAMEQIRKDMGMMQEVVANKLLIPFIFFKRPQWDKFKGAENTFASDTLNPDGRRIQISSTHDLGTNFAEAFHVMYMDKNGSEQYAHQTCFGPGIWRLIATLTAIHSDDQGLILPTEVAPTQVVITPITFAGKDSSEALKHAEEVKKIVKGLGYRTHLDSRDHITPGEKYNIWELKGVPIRLEIGPREAAAKTATLVRRSDKKKETIKTDKNTLENEMRKQMAAIDAQIKENAQNYFKNRTKEAETLKEVKATLDKHRGFVKAPFCSMELDGQECADVLKAQTTAIVCGTPLEHEKILIEFSGSQKSNAFQREEKPKKTARCCICTKPAKHIVYIAKSV